MLTVILILLHSLLNTENADMPQNFISALHKDNVTGRCEVRLGWNPPANIAQSDITHYRVFINRENVMNVTNDNNQSLFMSSHPVCSCVDNEVWISAINRCGDEGQRTLTIELDQEPIPLSLYPCETETTTRSNDFTGDKNPSNGKVMHRCRMNMSGLAVFL